MDRRLLALIPLLVSALWLSSPRSALTQELAPAVPLGAGFTYQGYLKSSNGAPITSTCDLRFSLFDASGGGAQIGADSTTLGVAVNQGYFSTLANAGGEFGANAFDNANARWLEVEVKCTGDASYTTLSPRQPLGRSLDTHDHFGQSWSGSGTGLTLSGGSVGVFGSGSTNGVFGQSASTAGYGVYGYTTTSTGSTRGVYGLSDSQTGTGVYGLATATTGGNYGVWGQSKSAGGIGVYGAATSITGFTFGMVGQSDSTAGTGMYGYAANAAGFTYGVFGQSDSTDGIGVYGHATTNSGSTAGVIGHSESTQGYGVYGSTTATTGTIYGVYGASASTSGRGVMGISTATTGVNYGVMGQNASTSGRGVFGTATNTTGANFGVYGSTSSPGGFAGYFSGNTHVTGTLTKGGGGFKIDHPLDPANQYLYHSFVESPEMMNIYHGTVSLDASGQAWVQMPAWFETLNQDFHYQLTCIGGFAPVYIAQSVQNNSFLIAGGTPGMQVSWQVTGVRHDPWAEANRQEVEQPKPPEEQNQYLHPELYGFPAELGLHYLPLDDQLAVLEPLAPAALPPLPAAPAVEPPAQPN